MLTVDLKIHEIQDVVEMKAPPRCSVRWSFRRVRQTRGASPRPREPAEVLGREKNVYETTTAGELRKRRNIDPSAAEEPRKNAEGARAKVVVGPGRLNPAGNFNGTRGRVAAGMAEGEKLCRSVGKHSAQYRKWVVQLWI